MTLIREAIQKIEELVGKTQEFKTQQIHDNLFYINRAGQPVRIYKSDECEPDGISFKTLTGIVDYINVDLDGHDLKKCAVVVESPLSVKLVSAIDPNLGNSRFILANTKTEPINFKFGDPLGGNDPWYDLINFVIALQSQFRPSDEVEDIITMLSNLHNEKVVQQNDDGFAQALQIRTGITTKAQVDVKNPVTLAPYRTFREVEQPEGEFILRFEDGNRGIKCALFMADGGQWELAAIKKIKEYLEVEINTDISILA